ncbi:class D beta-lactamase [Burkholderia pseudomultivorans]|uniref:OXA-1043 family class D beta-lactamase n=1 Tax=Burkholderia pseudomultivorans TaxID=1207504 RepID=UPI00075522CD|nr:OXA-1043 family class D beta-lactamase [Burkholderia pseudomultivorans]KVC40986.1 class D beta-lactamase [Burkholderia pseudomultivorans]
MKHWRHALFVVTAGLLTTAAAQARPVCTVVADAATGRVLVQQGDCATRVTPASTFKVAISLMGFDAGVLKDEHTPTLDFHAGYPDWGGAPWREPTDPARWMKLSIFWYSEQVTQALGQARFQQYTSAFGYGNADVTSRQGELSGVMGAWVNSSLQISPLEQVGFMRGIANRTPPVSAHAYDMTERITLIDRQPDGWIVHGKTGTGSPGARYDASHAYGWFVGWATRGPRKLAFAYLIQDEQRQTPNAGLRARDTFLDALLALAEPGRPQ